MVSKKNIFMKNISISKYLQIAFVYGYQITRTLIFPCQGYVGCLVDTELVHDKHVYSGARSLYYAHDSAAATGRVSVAHETLTTRTPDTSFYQWVPFVLVFQVQWE